MKGRNNYGYLFYFTLYGLLFLCGSLQNEISACRVIVFQSYEAAFQTIKEATGIEDIDLLVTKFIEVEDKNFALFNYVNELNNEIEQLQEQINEVKTYI